MLVRNPNPTLISLIAAFVISVAGGGLTHLLTGRLNIAVFIFGFLALLSFLVHYYSTELFIYRKIKLIYKTIHDFRSQKKIPALIRIPDIDGDPVGEVNREVEEWIHRSSSELEELRRQELFRKEFLGNVSHELKTPIFNLTGYIHTLLDGAINDPEVNMRFLEKAAKSADRMAALVEDLISISQLESGQLKMEPELYDINEQVHDIYEQLEIRAKDRNIRLQVKDGCDTVTNVYSDKYRIRQVLVNLIVNGIQYGRENGSIMLSYYDMGDNILVEVADNGEGIEKEHLPRLFERFYRVDKARSRDEGGTGLGLAIVKHIIEAHGQTIHVRSTRQVGTTFGFTMAKNQDIYQKQLFPSAL